MAANTAPIYTGTPDVQWATADGNGGPAGGIKTANTAKDGTGTVTTVLTAGANGEYTRTLTARSLGTNMPTVLRIFINNGSTNATVANNILIGEVTLAATTLSEVSAIQPYEFVLNRALPAGYKINCTLGTTVSAGYALSIDCGQY